MMGDPFLFLADGPFVFMMGDPFIFKVGDPFIFMMVTHSYLHMCMVL